MNDSLNTALMNAPFRGFEKISSIYFVGIGGIGMSAIARFFYSHGVRVSGYDKTVTVLTKELEATGIAIQYDDVVEEIPKDVDLVVYTPAIPKDHQGLQYYREQGYKVVKRSDVLQIITASSFNICIAGTHGKTTITSMVAHVLRDTGFGCNAFLGGISVNYGTNFWSSERNVCVVEADEYDRSFLKLSPDMAIITAMDADHLDIYGTAEAVRQAFVDFSHRIKPGGLLVTHTSLDELKNQSKERVLVYGLSDKEAAVHADHIRMMNGGYEFDVVLKDEVWQKVRLNMGGLHNIENALAAIAVANALGIDEDKVKAAIAGYRGVKRRFEYVVRTERMVYIDDYAHHPEELRALIKSAKSLFPGKTCTVIFQPHLFTRTRDFASGFAEVLSMADEVVLLPVYPARELPMEGVNSKMISKLMKVAKVHLLEKDELTTWIKERFGTGTDAAMVITAGAGDIDTLVFPIGEILKKIK